MLKYLTQLLLTQPAPITPSKAYLTVKEILNNSQEYRWECGLITTIRFNLPQNPEVTQELSFDYYGQIVLNNIKLNDLMTLTEAEELNKLAMDLENQMHQQFLKENHFLLSLGML